MGFFIFAILIAIVLLVIVTLCMGFIPRVFCIDTYVHEADQNSYE